MHRKTTLKNNLRVVTVPIKQTRVVTVLILVRAGSRNENKKENGLAHFIEHMFFKGGKKYPNTQAVAEVIDGAGGVFNAFTGKETVGYWIKITSEKLPLALDVLSDMLLRAKFEPQEIKREKGVINEEIHLYEDTPLLSIYDLFEQTLFGNTNLGRSTLGKKESVLKFKQRDFLDYLKKLYWPSNMVICLAGNIDHQYAVRKINKFFVFPKRKFQFYFEKFKKPKNKPRINLKYKKTNQVHLGIGFKALSINNSSIPTLEVLNAVLGASMSSRLFINIRERRGLAYAVRSSIEKYVDTGYLQVYVGTSLKQVEKTISLILQEFKNLKEKLISTKELKKGKEFIKGRNILDAEDSEFVANYFAEQALLVSKIKTFNQFFTEINKVTPAKVQNLSRKLFVNQNLNLAIIGPFKNKKPFEKILKL
jgi:predicted Zn-dependent peptidase